MRVLGVAALVALLLAGSLGLQRCVPPTDSPLPSNSRFAVVLSGGPKTYVPGQTYRVSVEGRRDGDLPLKFTGFILTAEPGDDASSRRNQVGHFTLYGDALAKFDERCANTVTHATFLPTAEVQVLWTAPPPGSGCVIFRASVQETRDSWYADDIVDAPLTPKVCEDRQENMDEQRPILSRCCACDEAKYEVTFEGLWSRHTHPKDFPADSWVTRFSDVIGASHDVEYRFWDYNGMATEGLRQVAERGSTRALEAELKAQSEHIRTIIKARGISYPNVTGRTFAVFRVDQKNHLMSLVSMIDPSPDWIVGVSGLELCLSNCSWVDRVQLNMYPFDAGTDSGITYIAPDQPTRPQEPIRKMSSSFPNDLRSPFFDPTGEPMRPMARLSLVRQRLYEKVCEDRGSMEGEDQDADMNNKEGCEVGDWEPWPECPVTCGRGMRHRQRFYVNAELAVERGCSRVLTSRQQCAAGQKQCPGLGGFRDVENDPECELTPWSQWSSCSAKCGRGTRTRSRKYKHRAGKRCTMAHRPVLQQNDPCTGQDGEACGDAKEQLEPPNGCILSEWSQWSVCSASCGRGRQYRSRYPLDGQGVPDGETPKSGPCAGIPMREHVFCIADPSCHIRPEQAKEVCRLPADPGPCRGHLQRWFFHPDSRICHAFEYGGCRGNRNNFLDRNECEHACREFKDSLLADRNAALERYGVRLSGAITYSEPSGKAFRPLPLPQPQPQPTQQQQPQPLPAHRHQHHARGQHSATSSPPTTPMAGNNLPFNGMQPVAQVVGSPMMSYIPEEVLPEGSVTTGVQGDVVDCKLSAWSPWGPCDVTCGVGYRVRQRTIEVSPQNGGQACPNKLLGRKKCRLPPCVASLIQDNEEEDDDENMWGRHYRRENDCVMSAWSEWSRCTTTCGVNAQQIRSRKILQEAGPGGRPCGHRSEVQSCSLLPCPRERPRDRP